MVRTHRALITWLMGFKKADMLTVWLTKIQLYGVMNTGVVKP